MFRIFCVFIFLNVFYTSQVLGLESSDCPQRIQPTPDDPTSNIKIMHVNTTGDCYISLWSADKHHHYMVNITSSLYTFKEAEIVHIDSVCDGVGHTVKIPGSSSCNTGEGLMLFAKNENYDGSHKVVTNEIDGTVSLIADCLYKLPFGPDSGTIDYTMESTTNGKMCKNDFSASSKKCNSFQVTEMQVPDKLGSSAYYTCNGGNKHEVVDEQTYTCGEGEKMTVVLDGTNWRPSDKGYLRGRLLLVECPKNPDVSSPWIGTVTGISVTIAAAVAAGVTTVILKKYMKRSKCCTKGGEEEIPMLDKVNPENNEKDV